MRRLSWILGVMAAGLAVYGFWWEPSSLRVVHHAVHLEPSNRLSSAPLRIAVIADLHGGAPYVGEDKIEEIVRLTNDAKPDLILLAGDYITKGVLGGSSMPIEAIAGKFAALSAPLGVYAVLGNHDRYDDPDAAHYAKVFESAGIAFLDDRNVTLAAKGGTLYLAGISDMRSAPHDMVAALSGIPEEARALCFTHSPDIFPRLPAACSLTIAGHTHGGQVWLPLIGPPIVPSEFGQRYASGLVHENGKYLFVSTGIGTSIIPVRIGVPPEISILEID
jgi:hypothetical protein